MVELMHPRCAGIDVAKKGAKVCLRGAGDHPGVRTKQKVTSWGSMTSDILRLREYLLDERVTCVVMEATGEYWKPFYYVLEDAGFELILANARSVKNVAGRKTDVSDSAWLADLGAHGLVRASFVPPPPIRQLRDLTRTRTTAARDRARVLNRLDRVLQDAGIKLSSVASALDGVSSTSVLQAMVAGERDPQKLAGLVHYRMRPKLAQLVEALTGRFTDHHAFLVQQHLAQLEQLSVSIDALTARIEVEIEPFRPFRDLIITIPGVSVLVADVVIAETGGDMSQFASADHLASWAGMSPGQHESAGVKKAVKTRPGDRWLKGAIGVSARAARNKKGSFYAAKFRRLASRRGPGRALVAVGRAQIVAIWHMGMTGTVYQDPGGDYYTRRNPEQAKRQSVKRLEALGYRVTLEAS